MLTVPEPNAGQPIPAEPVALPVEATPNGNDKSDPIALKETCPTGYIPSGPNCLPTVHLRQVHTAEDLFIRGCDIWNPGSLACKSASNRYCTSRGYAGGYGPIEWAQNAATVVCLGSVAGAYLEVGYSGQCTGDNPTSLFCQDLALSQCQARGYLGATNVVEANTNVIGAICIQQNAINVGPVYTSLAHLQSINPALGCSSEAIIRGTGACQHNSSRFCQSQGFASGFDVSIYDGNQGVGLICVGGTSVMTEVNFNPSFGLERPAVLGTRLMGGPNQNYENPNLTAADVIYNAFDFPIVVTYVQPTTTHPIALDSCFYLNAGGIWQHNGSWDGELMCVGPPGDNASASMNYGQFGRGVLLNPGERITFQASTPNGNGNYNFAWVNFARADQAVPMRRMRFPRWDSMYMVPANGSVKVDAGCKDTSCPTVPMHGAGPYHQTKSSNYWFAAPGYSAIRGLSIYNGSTFGIIRATLRIALQGGANILTYSFEMRGGSNPASFNAWLGPQQNGSSFVPLDIDVPAGALVGIDYELINPTGTANGIDFGGYVWFDQRPGYGFTPPIEF